MDVVVVGGHGKVARRLLALLAQEGHRARGVVRKPDHAADLEAIGAEPAICDIEREDLFDVVAGADAVVFTAGAGPGSGPERKRTVDLGGALKLIDAAKAHDIRRYLMISSMGAGAPEDGPEQMRPYLLAKAEADAALVASGLDHTIVRRGPSPTTPALAGSTPRRSSDGAGRSPAMTSPPRCSRRWMRPTRSARRSRSSRGRHRSRRPCARSRRGGRSATAGSYAGRLAAGAGAGACAA